MAGVGEQIRDRFFALPASASEADKRALLAEVERLNPEPTTHLHGLALSFFPTARFKQLRFVPAAELDEQVRPLFARPCAALPELAAAFVDPEEFSFRSFENIIGLDRMFAELGPDAIRLAKPERLAGGVSRSIARASEPLRARLAQLDQLDLYVRPLNAVSRGGKRFIFHCAELATTLTTALRDALPESMLAGFVHVNPVFRCNRFEPGDKRFLAHVDSPYYDRAHHQVSKYTLLLYLTGGRGEALLRFADELVIDEIEPMTAFVFDQRLEHEGGPYVDGRKLFLRTELIFEDPNLGHAPGIAELFAKACYLDFESLIAPELARFAHAAYDRAAAAHFRGPPDRVEPEPYVHKQFNDVHFVSNGYDFWFHKDHLSLAECAAIALLDMLNAKIGDSSFRKLCSTQVLVRSSDDQSWIAELLRESSSSAPQGLAPVFARVDKPALFPPPEEPRDDMEFPTSPDFHADPFPDDWDATRHPAVVEAYARAQRYAKSRILPAPIMMLGQEVFLDPSRFVIEADKIHVLSTESFDPVHFAGAVWYSPDDFLDVDATFDVLRPLVPPIRYREAGDVFHLCCDLFRNSWMVSHRTETVPVPRVVNGTGVDPASMAWFDAAALSSSRDQLRAELEADEE